MEYQFLISWFRTLSIWIQLSFDLTNHVTSLLIEYITSISQNVPPSVFEKSLNADNLIWTYYFPISWIRNSSFCRQLSYDQMNPRAYLWIVFITFIQCLSVCSKKGSKGLYNEPGRSLLIAYSPSISHNICLYDSLGKA